MKKEAAMTFDRKEMIGKLKMELEILDKGGYAPSVHKPYRMPRVFRDSVSCPNVGLDIKIEPCTHCFLMEFVPPEHADKEDACHHIPLNARGDTVASLDRPGNESAVHEAVRGWLKRTIARLEEEEESNWPERNSIYFPQESWEPSEARKTGR
jgi:hypothetical protein